MKTLTRQQIIDIVRKNGKTRPAKLAALLKLSPQAIHRQLRKLVDEGSIVARGSPPVTTYMLSGWPDFESAIAWMKTGKVLSGNDSCRNETRDALTARLPRMKTFLHHGLPPEVLPLVISTTGEVANNSFDHNLGQWQDAPGCWMEGEVIGRQLWICVGDRGQGVFRSLSRVDPSLTDDQAALETAFEKMLSGRAPEKRGNGLKFVRNNVEQRPGAGLACCSGTGLVSFGEWGERCADVLRRHFTKVEGTFTLIVWSLP
ncbi:MAG: winged helix-turn-helix transcriptional regulator [Myxococcaceae bacterium]